MTSGNLGLDDVRDVTWDWTRLVTGTVSRTRTAGGNSKEYAVAPRLLGVLVRDKKIL